MREIEWLVARDELGRAVFGLSAQDYEDAAMNNAAVLRTLEQRKAQVKYYRSCLSETDKKPEPKPFWRFWE